MPYDDRQDDASNFLHERIRYASVSTDQREPASWHANRPKSESPGGLFDARAHQPRRKWAGAGRQGNSAGEFDRGAGEAAIARHELRVTNCASRLALEMKWWRARQESNLYQELRKLSFYPLNYGRSAREAVLYPSLSSVHEIDQIPAQTARKPGPIHWTGVHDTVI